MQELIKIMEKEGKQLVSARELYLGLELGKGDWSRWYPRNIINNEFFKENIDWTGFGVMLNGNETMDFAISLDFAKHIAMMARTEKSHKYRNYFIDCEKQIKNKPRQLTPKEELRLHYEVIEENTKEIETLKTDITDLKDNMPLFNVECKELQALVRKVGIKALGGYKSPAYKDSSLRCRIYQDIQQQLKREFGVTRYEAIKRCQLEKAIFMVNNYTIPFVLEQVVQDINNQIGMEEVI